MASEKLLQSVLDERRAELLDAWVEHQVRSAQVRDAPISDDEVRTG